MGPGQALRGNVLHEQIGQGEFGLVYRATQPATQRPVAVKVIPPDVAGSADYIHRFETEARTIADLEHPHVLPLYDFWREPGGAYLVFRYLSGGTARENLVAGGPWSLPAAEGPGCSARYARTPPARYGEGSVEGIVWGTKFAIASVRSPMANHRVVLGIEHFSSMSGGGEGRVFTDLALDLSRRSAGIHAYAADGASRGKHLQAVQSDTGCGVITPARRLISRNGGITIGRYSFAAQPLPWSPRRQKREAACGGHQLWAAAGTIFEQAI